jgi:3-dehydroquinate dehydratase-2
MPISALVSFFSHAMPAILLLHGPNLNLLGEREPHIYGHATLPQLETLVAERARALGHAVRAFQSNHEGVLLDRLHEARAWAAGCLFNPGALTHYAWSLRDAVAAVKYPVVEVHLSDPKQREAFRHLSVLEGVAAHSVAGKGLQGYLEAMEWLSAKLKSAVS